MRALPARPDVGSRRVYLAVAAVFVLAFTSDCGGDDQMNGLEKKTAAQVQQDAAAALGAAKTVHVAGTRLSEGKPVRLDLRLQDGLATGVVTLTDTQAEFARDGDDFYLKGDQRAWQALLAPPAVDGFTGRWVKLRTEQVTVEIVSIESLVAQLTDNAWLLEPKVERTALDGRNVVVLSQHNGSRLYVASTGPAYPVRMEDKKPNGWEIGFAEHGADFHLTVPSNALSNALTAAESAWLDAVKKLSTRMERIFEAIPTNLTPSAMAATGNKLRACDKELARIGPSSDRLQPVHALVREGCREYERGAQCFATAAGIGIPFAGSAAERKQGKAIECGFASAAAGAHLADAVNKGEEISSQVT